jgi:hypothetical protein
MSTFTPPLFKNLGKDLSDLLKKKYDFGKDVKIKTVTAGGLALESTVASGKGGNLTGNVKTTLKTADIGTFETELSTDGTTKATVTADKVSKGLVVKVSGTQKLAGSVDVDYRQDFYAASAGADVSAEQRALRGSLVVGFDGLSVGAAAEFDARAQAVTNYNAGVEYSQSDFTGSIVTANKADVINTSYLHRVSSDVSLGGLFSYDISSGARDLTVGGELVVDSATTVRAKANTAGVITTVLVHRLPKPALQLTFTSQFQARDLSAPEKFGLSFLFGDN